MAGLKKIADRIKTIQSTYQVTSAMKIVAVSRLRKLHTSFLKTTPYMMEMNRIVRRLIRSASTRQDSLTFSDVEQILPLPPLLKGNGKNKHYVLTVITSDDGLSGASNLMVVQKTQELVDYLQKQDKEITFFCFGTRGGEILKRLYPNIPMRILKRKLMDKDIYLDAERLSLAMIESFRKDLFDVCLLIYNQFNSVVSQKTTIEQLVPNKLFAKENPWQFLIDSKDPDYIRRTAIGEKKLTLHQSAFLEAFGGIDMLSPLGALGTDLLSDATRLPETYDYEPSDIGALHKILPQYIIAYVHRVLLETEVSDNAARLIAMDNATRNAKDMLAKLQKRYKRTRQDKITTEIAEVISGATDL